MPSDKHLLDQIQAVETSAIKIAFQLPPWVTNHWSYKLVNFDQIINRIKSNAKKFLENNAQDELIQPLIENMKPSQIGHHSSVFPGRSPVHTTKDSTIIK